jgi:benzoate-CoA ligase family protein
MGPADQDDHFNACTWLVDRQIAAGRGPAIAFRCGEAEQTYHELGRAVARAANGMRSLGIGAGDRVLMVVNDELAFPAVFLAGLRLAAVPVPVSTMLRAADLARLAADCDCEVVVVSERYAGHLPVMTADAPAVRAAVVIGAADVPALDGVDVVRWSAWQDETPLDAAPTTAASPGFWLYTSGTTGLPKGAIHRHGDLRAICETYADTVLAIGPDDVCYSVPKLFFAFGLGNALVFPLSVGATAVLDPEPATPARAAALLERHRPTLWFAPPGLCAGLLDGPSGADVLASVRAVVTAGEAFPPATLQRFEARFGTEVLDGIGSTEALHIFCSNRPGDVRPGTSGRPVAGYELRLLDERGEVITAPDTPGALWIRGASVAAGYHRRPDAEATAFVDGWLRTGDVYSCSADGYWRFVGRNSDMIKAGGIWVSPAEVENALLAHDDVLEAAVVGGRDDDGLETIVAFVVPRHGVVVDGDDLRAHCRATMAGFKRPRAIHVVEELPKTATGKIQRFALRAGLRAEVRAELDAGPAATATAVAAAGAATAASAVATPAGTTAGTTAG